MFGDAKTRGLNIEDTRLTCPRKLALLMAIVAIALAWAGRVAAGLLGTREPHRKSHGHLARSRFRIGLDHIRNLLRSDPGTAANPWPDILHDRPCTPVLAGSAPREPIRANASRLADGPAIARPKARGTVGPGFRPSTKSGCVRPPRADAYRVRGAATPGFGARGDCRTPLRLRARALRRTARPRQCLGSSGRGLVSQAALCDLKSTSSRRTPLHPSRHCRAV